MKVNFLLLCIIIYSFFFNGCSKKTNNSISQKGVAKIVEKIIEKETGKDAKVNIGKNGKSDITFKTEQGEEVTISTNKKTIPEDFPKDVYLIKGDIEYVSSVKADSKNKGGIINVTIKTDDEADEVANLILNKMKQNGWKNTMSMNSENGFIQIYSKDNNHVTVSINTNDTDTQISYMVTMSAE